MAGVPTAGVYRDAILTILGKSEFVQVQIDAFWAIQAVRTSDLYLCYLRTLNALIDGELGNLPQQNLALTGDDPRGTGARSQRDARRVELLAIRQSIASDLQTAEEATAGGVPVAGVITTTVPIPSPAGFPDANATRYRGDPNAWPGWGAQRP